MATIAPDGRGWQVGKPLVECIQHMLENEVDCDVTFEIQLAGNPDVKVSAHKMMLRARSPVFEAMFNGAFIESCQNVIITDIEPIVLRLMLGFIYTDEVNLTGEIVVQTLYAANKYILEGLSQKCEEFLDKQISVDNVCSILTHSLVYQYENLVNMCMDFIAPNAKAVSKTEAFYNMSHDALLKVVKCDQLALGVEAELFEGCLQWGRRNVRDPNPSDEELRELLEECLHHIRFTHIPPEQFAKRFGDCSVLSAEEKCLIFCVGLTQEESYNATLAESGFDVASRMVRVKRYEGTSPQDYVLSISESTQEDFTFSVNKPIELMGFSVFGGAAKAEHDVTVTVRHNDNEEDKQTIQSRIISKGDGEPLPVYIRKMRVKTNMKYRVCISVKGTHSVGYGWAPEPTLASETIKFTSSFHRYPCTELNDNFGYVAEILFQLL